MVWACKLLFEHPRWTAAPSEPQSGMPQPLLPAFTTNVVHLETGLRPLPHRHTPQ